VLAILLSNIDIIFDLIGAITCSFSTFLFPSYAFLLALYKYHRNSSQLRNSENLFYGIFAVVFILLGVGAIFVAIYLNVLTSNDDQETDILNETVV